MERPLIPLTLAATRGNQVRAAEILGLNRNTLRKKIDDLGHSGYTWPKNDVRLPQCVHPGNSSPEIAQPGPTLAGLRMARLARQQVPPVGCRSPAMVALGSILAVLTFATLSDGDLLAGGRALRRGAAR